MRVITGKARGRRLKTGGQRGTRPTQAAIREVLFNILRPRLANTRFLDVYAGYGIVGIEALSEGARWAVFIERSRSCCQILWQNLHRVGLAEQAEVLCEDAFRALRRLLAAGMEFDVIFADPPYEPASADSFLRWLGDHSSLLAAEGVCVVQHFFKHPVKPSYGELVRFRERRVGESLLSFYHRSPLPLEETL